MPPPRAPTVQQGHQCVGGSDPRPTCSLPKFRHCFQPVPTGPDQPARCHARSFHFPPRRVTLLELEVVENEGKLALASCLPQRRGASAATATERPAVETTLSRTGNFIAGPFGKMKMANPQSQRRQCESAHCRSSPAKGSDLCTPAEAGDNGKVVCSTNRIRRNGLSVAYRRRCCWQNLAHLQPIAVANNLPPCRRFAWNRERAQRDSCRYNNRHAVPTEPVDKSPPGEVTTSDPARAPRHSPPDKSLH